MHVVLDTNILLDLWVFADRGVASLAGALAAGRLLPVRSSTTDAEWRDVLSRPQFALSVARQAQLLADWQGLAQVHEPSVAAPWQCKDADDQKFLDLALAAGAGLLVSKDRAVLKLARQARAVGLSIVAPGHALEVALAGMPPARSEIQPTVAGA
jgi:uncharacterized protein